MSNDVKSFAFMLSYSTLLALVFWWLFVRKQCIRFGNLRVTPTDQRSRYFVWMGVLGLWTAVAGAVSVWLGIGLVQRLLG